MNNEQEILERLARIEENENRRMVFARIQLALVSLLVIGIVVILCVSLPKLQELYVQADAAISQAQGIMTETEGALKEMDWSRFKDLDIEGLNTAIANLNKVVAAIEEKAADMQETFDSVSQFFGQWFGN